MKELPSGVDGKRRSLFPMKRAQANKILRSSFLELDVIANHTDNVRLLAHRFFEITESSHERFRLFCLKIRGRGMPQLWCNCASAETETILGDKVLTVNFGAQAFIREMETALDTDSAAGSQ